MCPYEYLGMRGDNLEKILFITMVLSPPNLIYVNQLSIQSKHYIVENIFHIANNINSIFFIQVIFLSSIFNSSVLFNCVLLLHI